MRNKILLIISILCQTLVYAQFSDLESGEAEVVTNPENPFVIDESTTDYLQVDTSFKSRYQDKEHTYTEPKPKKEEVKKPDETSRSVDFGGVGTFAKVVFYAFLVLVVGLIIYLLVKSLSNFRYQKKEKLNSVEVENESESDLIAEPVLDKIGLENQIVQAKNDQNYPLAIRYYFLLYLEKLEQKKILTYHIDKTNSDYLAEMTDDTYSAQFVKCSHLFEYVWYGKKPIDLQSFTVLENTFNEQLDKIK